MRKESFTKPEPVNLDESSTVVAIKSKLIELGYTSLEGLPLKEGQDLNDLIAKLPKESNINWPSSYYIGIFRIIFSGETEEDKTL